jgi:hypothetical protein
MKSLLITAAIVGAVAAAIILYLSDETSNSAEGEVGDAAEDAYKTMNKHIGRVERQTEKAIDGALG